MNQVHPNDTPLRKKTKKSRMFYASPLDIDEEINPRPCQVALPTRKGAKNDILDIIQSEELSEPTIIVSSNLLVKLISLKELSPLEEDISSL